MTRSIFPSAKAFSQGSGTCEEVGQTASGGIDYRLWDWTGFGTEEIGQVLEGRSLDRIYRFLADAAASGCRGEVDIGAGHAGANELADELGLSVHQLADVLLLLSMQRHTPGDGRQALAIGRSLLRQTQDEGSSS